MKTINTLDTSRAVLCGAISIALLSFGTVYAESRTTVIEPTPMPSMGTPGATTLAPPGPYMGGAAEIPTGSAAPIPPPPGMEFPLPPPEPPPIYMAPAGRPGELSRDEFLRRQRERRQENRPAGYGSYPPPDDPTTVDAPGSLGTAPLPPMEPPLSPPMPEMAAPLPSRPPIPGTATVPPPPSPPEFYTAVPEPPAPETAYAAPARPTLPQYQYPAYPDYRSQGWYQAPPPAYRGGYGYAPPGYGYAPPGYGYRWAPAAQPPSVPAGYGTQPGSPAGEQ